MSTHEWISQYLCTPKKTCPSDLGCGNMRVWCTIGSPYSALEFMNNTFELHWVSASTLQDLTVGESKTRATDAWIGYLEELNGDDMRFSAFSHNKVQLFARNVTAYAERFAAGGVPTLKRLSYDAAGVAVAHVSVAVAGRVYEIVGAATGAETAWPAWSSAECAPAHGLPDTVAFYDGAAKTAFWRERGFGFGELLVVNIGASFHDPLATSSSPPRSSTRRETCPARRTESRGASSRGGAKARRANASSDTATRRERTSSTRPSPPARLSSSATAGTSGARWRATSSCDAGVRTREHREFLDGS